MVNTPTQLGIAFQQWLREQQILQRALFAALTPEQQDMFINSCIKQDMPRQQIMYYTGRFEQPEIEDVSPKKTVSMWNWKFWG
jgi:hypothetical protein